MSDFVPWLKGLAEKGGKGVVNNIDARCLGRVADEIERLRADLATYGKDTVATENRIIDAEFAAQELRTVLQEILDGFGLYHLSKFCRDKAASALSPHKETGAV